MPRISKLNRDYPHILHRLMNKKKISSDYEKLFIFIYLLTFHREIFTKKLIDLTNKICLLIFILSNSTFIYFKRNLTMKSILNIFLKEQNNNSKFNVSFNNQHINTVNEPNFNFIKININ
jgi:dipeptide/tripeptide permease